MVLAVNYIWDTTQDAREFSNAFADYAMARFGAPVSDRLGQIAWDAPDGYHLLHYRSDQTIWVFAPDADTAAAILDALLNP